MDGSGHTASEERGAEKLMDDYLRSIGFHRKRIAKDGSCLFRAVAEQVLHCQSLHTKVRTKCVEFLKQNRENYEAFIEGDFEQYLCKLQDPQQWVGEVEINALAAIYKKDFQIYQEPGKPPVNITDNNFKDKVRLCFLNGNHYDSVYPTSRIKNAALCQSIVYEVMYEDVFKVDRSSLGLCQRASRPTDFLSDDSMAACASSDGSDLETDEPLWLDNGTSTSSTKPNSQSHRGRGRGRQLPERVRRSLNPTLLRNVEFDVWHKSKRAQQKMDYCIAAGMQYTVGDRCQVRLEGTGRNYSATVKEVPPNENLVIVHIEELGKRSVPLWNLRPPAAENSWCTVVNKDKRLSNGSGDWEERGKGRGRGKPVPPPSSVPQASSPGSSGRVQKQHSWPPQATVDEQGGAKPSRKSGSLSESSPFGLTDKERLAKEEEERNVALVEIQLRDEHSFPALGTGSQADGARKKGPEKRPSQRNKTSPVEDIRAASPSAGERPKSTTPPPISTTVTTAPSTPPTPNLPAAKPAASPSSTCSSTNTTASPSGSAPGLTPACAAPSAKPSVTGGALSQSVPCSAAHFSFLTPVLPTASAALSSSSSVPPKSTTSPPPTSIQPPTFIAPIAPSPSQGFLPPSSLHRSSPPVSSLPHSPSPPSSSSSLIHHAAQVREAPAQKPLPNSGGISVAKPQTSLTPASLTQGDIHTQPCLPKHQTQSQASLIQSQIQMPQMQKEIQSSIPLQHQPQPLTEVPQTQAYLPQTQACLPQNQASLPQTQACLPQTQACLPQNQACLPETQAYLPQNQACLPQNQACLPQTQASLPQTQACLPETQAYLPQNQACLPETQAYLPQNQACLPQNEACLPETQAYLPQNQASLPQTQACLPQNQAYLPQTQAYLPQNQACLPHTQTSVLPHTQMSVPHHSSSQSQSDMVHIQSSHPHPGASYLHTSQASIPVSTSGYLQLSLPHAHPHSHPAQPPHPSQLPHPSVCIPASPTHHSLQTQNHTETPQPPPQPESPARPPSHPGHHPHATHHPHFLSAPQPQSIPGAIPLQNLSQLYQDPLYPGFPLGQKGDMVPTPPYSLFKSGDDLPQDVNILRFFFNMGVKAYSMPIYPPYLYLLPLQQAHAMQPKLPSRSPSPHFPPPNAPTRHQEAYSPNHPTSVPAQPPYGHQVALTEPHRPSEPSFNQAGYPVTQPPPHRMPCNSQQWRQHQMPPPSTSSYPVGYPLSASPYQLSPSSQGYHPGQGTGHPLYPPTMTPYPPSSLGYQSPSNPDELQVTQGAMEQLQPTNGDALSGHGPGQVPGPLDGSAAANVANANNRMVVSCVNNFALKEQGESLRRTVLLVDPPFNNRPILTLVSNSDDPVSMTTMKPSSTPGTQLPYGIMPKTTVPGGDNAPHYQVHPKQLYNKPYSKLGVQEPGKAGHLQTMPMMDGVSMACSTEDDWEDREGFKAATLTPRGSKRTYRGGRGRAGGYDGGRGGNRRRQGGEGFNHGQFGPSHRGRGW